MRCETQTHTPRASYSTIGGSTRKGEMIQEHTRTQTTYTTVGEGDGEGEGERAGDKFEIN